MFSFPPRAPQRHTKRQVSVIGLATYGPTFALSLIARSCATHLVLVDPDFQTAKGESLDILDALPFLPDIKLSYSSDVRATAHSDVVVIAVGKPFNAGFSNRMELLEQNTLLVADAAYAALHFSPNATLIVATDPMDVMTSNAVKSARRARPSLPDHRVIGIGTALDIARMRAFIAKQTGIGARDVVANIVGEHGNSMVPLWKYFRIRGMPLQDVFPDLTTQERKAALEEQVRNACFRIVTTKPEGTSKGIGECLADLTQSLLAGAGNVRTVCTCVTPDDFVGLKENVYMSVPCNVGSDGVKGVFPFEVDPEERSKILDAADILLKAQKRASQILDDVGRDPHHVHQFGLYSSSPAALTKD